MGTGTLGCWGWCQRHQGVGDRTSDTGVSPRSPAHLEALQEPAQVALQLRTLRDKHALLVQHVVCQEVHKGELWRRERGKRGVTGGQPPQGPPPKLPSSPPPTFSPANHGREPRNRDKSRSFPGSCSR